MTGKEKTAFRQKVVWKKFRLKMLAENKKRNNGKIRCELWDTVLTPGRAQVHHLRPDEYDVLEPERFRVLSPVAHDLIEHLAVVFAGKANVPNKDKWLELLGPFLPVVERETDKYYAMLENHDVKKI